MSSSDSVIVSVADNVAFKPEFVVCRDDIEKMAISFTVYKNDIFACGVGVVCAFLCVL